jgi:alkyl sulfatase BDS1-like metallo-beta-lactamase superfamily hydrolase
MEKSHTKGNPASPFTVTAQKALRKNLPLQDKQDLEFVKRGFIATAPDNKIVDQNGQLIRDLQLNEFLNNSCPDTVNPSLWRNSQLLFPHGLFKVTDGVYQVRGFDLANMTIIRGKTGYIIIDTLCIAEAAKAGMDLVREHLGDLNVVAVIHTHSHIDHYGGVEGVINKADVTSGRTAVIAPAGFMKEIVSEFVLAGPAMNRRAMYQFGNALAVGPIGSVSGGIGPTLPPKGTVSVIAPTREIMTTGETMVIDGLTFVFQVTPNTEAPAEMNIYLPEFKALCMAENANGCMHQLYPLRGAQVRDAKQWADKLTESIRLFGDDAEVVFTSHFWPRWGRDVIIDYLSSHRDAYKYMHDQTVRLMNLGLTSTEIAEEITLPDSLANRWFNRGNYGAVKQNVKSVYYKYLGWYDGNPAHLDSLPPEEAGKRYVTAMGGPEKVISMAREAIDNGEFQWAAELVDRVIFSDINNKQAQLIQADILEQLGYQAESAAWRNAYLMAAFELRKSDLKEAIHEMPDNSENLAVPHFLDVMSIRLVPSQAGGKRFKVNLEITDLKEQYVLSLSNSVLVYETGVTDKNADGTISMEKQTLWLLFSGQEPANELIARGKLKTTGKVSFLSDLADLFEKPSGMFNLVIP